jgi:hypothetical protein
LIERNEQLIVEFFNKIIFLNNVRVVIADRDITEKSYRKYVFNNNYFEMTTDENTEILKKIASFDLGWSKAEEILSSTEIHLAPIFIVLFVITRTSEIEISVTKGLDGQFVDIIEHDFNTIANKYPGLAKALYYWSHISYHFGVQITWWAFLHIADYYNNDSTISQALKVDKTHQNDPSWPTQKGPLCQLKVTTFAKAK